MKRRLSVLLAVVVLLAAVVLLAPSAAAETTGEFETVLQNDKLYITGYSGTLPAELVIPEKIDGVPVYGMTEISDWTWESETLTSVVLPDSMRDIPEYAFRSCHNLQSVHIGAGISQLSGRAFYWTSVSNITVSESSSYYTVIDGVLYDKAVENMIYCPLSSEDSHQIPATVKSFPIGQQWTLDRHIRPTLTVEEGSPYLVCEDGVLYTADKTTVLYCNSSYSGAYIMPDTVISMDRYAFQDCKGMESVTISNSVTAISYGAFENCSALQTVTIPPSVTSIDTGGFVNCTGLDQVHISDIAAWCGISINYWDDNPLYYAENLYLNGKLVTDLVLPESVTAVKAYTFINADCLTSVTGSANLKAIGWSTFQSCDQLATIDFRKSLQGIDGRAFSDCSQLSTVRLPQGLESIGKEAFASCTSLKSITIPDTVTYIGDYCFTYCAKLNKIQLSQELTHINDGTFCYCESLVAITIPDSVQYIYTDAFYNCTALKQVNLPKEVAFGQDVFGNCPLGETPLHQDWADTPPYLFSNSALQEFSIPDTVNTLCYRSFYSCDDLKNVGIPLSVTTIEAHAFTNTDNLENVYYEGSQQQWAQIQIGDGNDPLSNATLHANYNLPKITQQPVSYKATGNTATFSVTATGNIAAYQWQYRTSSRATWVNTSASGAKTATLNVSVTASKNGYQYRCIITDQVGLKAFSDAATLTVSDLLISAQPANQYLPAGKTAKFTVKATGTGLSYQWQYRASAKGSWKNTTATGNKTATLSVPATATRNGYQYRCKVTDQEGSVVYSNAATLKVVTLKVTTQPANEYLPAGKTAKFTVKASGTELKYQWQYRTSSSGSWKNASAAGNKTATLSVPATATRNGYQYRCKITDQYGNVIYSNAATLKIVTLKITTQPSSVTLAKGKTATFKVVAKGTGLTYQWQYRTSAKGSWKQTSATGNKTATLKVPVTAARNGYQYRCVITDRYGNVINSAAATLKVK